jgi:hypothetical protein
MLWVIPDHSSCYTAGGHFNTAARQPFSAKVTAQLVVLSVSCGLTGLCLLPEFVPPPPHWDQNSECFAGQDQLHGWL